MRARAAALADEINRGQGKLEARLDAVIDLQRKLLDEARRAWAAIKQAGGADPLAQSTTLGKLADDERGIVAEAGVIGDLASDEIDSIGKKPEDKRTQEETVRVVQLKNLDIYLLDGRGKIAEARRKLQDFDAENGVVARRGRARRAQARARAAARSDHRHARGRARRARADAADRRGRAGRSASRRRWRWARPRSRRRSSRHGSSRPRSRDRQGTLHDRLDEVRARLQAGVDNADKPSNAGLRRRAAQAQPPSSKE